MRKVLALLSLVALIACSPSGVALAQPAGARAADDDAATYRYRALRTQSFTYARLAYPPGPERCPSGKLLTFRRTADAAQSDAWHVASQLMADVALAEVDGPGFQCTSRKMVGYLDLLRQEGAAGGYWPRSNLDGRGVTQGDIFVDDNALIGLALLEARAAGGDPAWRDTLLRRARAAGVFLVEGDWWDQTFGGGFWWATGRGALYEGKPAQTTALAGLMFARLYEETGDQLWADWARRCLDWLDRRLFDPQRGVYRYGLRHADLEQRSGELLDPQPFSYDQGLVIELHLALSRKIEPAAGHLERARALADRMRPNFWEPSVGGYRLNAFLPELWASYGAWTSASLVALYEADGDPRWLDEARANLDALESVLADGDGGYFQLYSHCDVPEAWGCRQGAPSALDRTKVLPAQAWMERAQALAATAPTRAARRRARPDNSPRG